MLNLRKGHVKLDGEDIRRCPRKDQKASPRTEDCPRGRRQSFLDIGREPGNGRLPAPAIHRRWFKVSADLFPILKDKRRQQRRTSGGFSASGYFVGRALMTQPKLLMLDEPTASIFPIVMDELFDRIMKVARTSASRSPWSTRTPARRSRSPTRAMSASRAPTATPTPRRALLARPEVAAHTAGLRHGPSQRDRRAELRRRARRLRKRRSSCASALGIDAGLWHPAALSSFAHGGKSSAWHRLRDRHHHRGCNPAGVGFGPAAHGRLRLHFAIAATATSRLLAVRRHRFYRLEGRAGDPCHRLDGGDVRDERGHPLQPSTSTRSAPMAPSS